MISYILKSIYDSKILNDKKFLFEHIISPLKH